MRVEVGNRVGYQGQTTRASPADIDLPWDVAALGLAVAVAAGICPALDALAERLSNADCWASSAHGRRCAKGGGPDERHDEAVRKSIDCSEEQLMTVKKVDR